MTTPNDGATDPQNAGRRDRGRDQEQTASGMLLAGRYELGAVVGTGGMAEVRLGIDRRLGRKVAVKVLLPGLAVDPSFQTRFRREAKAAGALNHRSIVAVYDTGEETLPDGSSVLYIVMEYVEGRTLRDILRQDKRVPFDRALYYIDHVLDALAYSHRASIVHRDIKPGNVMVTAPGAVKVMDFGIARALADGQPTMTKTSAVIGTAHYLSPEQARGEKVDGRSDIYSTGCLLYELLTGRPPFVGESPVAVLYQHVREEPAPPSTHEPNIPPAVDAVTMKALGKKPFERYQTADEMRADIGRALAGQYVAPPVVATPPVPVEPPAGELSPGMDPAAYELEPEPHRKAKIAAVAAAAVVMLGLGGFMLDQLRGGEEPRTPVVEDTTGDQKTPRPPRTPIDLEPDTPSQEPTPSEDDAEYEEPEPEDPPEETETRSPTPAPTPTPTPTPTTSPTETESPTEEPTEPTTPPSTPAEPTDGPTPPPPDA